MQVPKAKLSGFDNQLLKMSCQTGDYNFSSYGTWRPSGFRTEAKMGTQTFSIASENRKKHLLQYILQTEHKYINTDFV